MSSGQGHLRDPPRRDSIHVEPQQPLLGTVRREALPYRNVDISKFYPYGDVSFP